MLYNTKLNEFESHELDRMLKLVNEEIKTLFSCQKDTSKWDESELKDTLTKKYESELDIMLLWKVQIQNALNDIKEMNKINAR
jgi:hypothetical protein